MIIISIEKEDNFEKINETSIKHLSITKPSTVKWILVVVITLFSNFLWLLIIDVPPLLLLIIVTGVIILSIVFWKFFGRWSVRILVLKNIQKYKEGKIGFLLKYSLKFIGIHFDAENQYYLEEKAYHRNYNTFKDLFYDKLLDPVSSSLGVGFLLLTFIKPFLTSINEALFTANIILVSTPFLAGFIIPFYWIIKDARIRYTDQNNDVFKAEENIRKSTLNRFLGFSGFVAGINFLLESLPELPPFTNIQSTLVLFILAVIVLLVVSLIIAGINLLVATVYLTNQHQTLVNELRNKISKFISIGETNVKLKDKEI